MTTGNYVKSARTFSALIPGLVLLIGSLYWMSSGHVAPARAANTDSGIQPAADTPTLVVTTTAETATDNCTATSCSLRGAITAAHNRAGDDVIGFAPGVSGKIDLNSALPPLDNNLKIIGPGASLLTVEPKGFNFRIFMINPGVNVTLSGLTLANAFATDGLGGKAVYNKGTLTVIDCAIAGGVSSGNGTGIRNDGVLTVTGTTFSNNGGAQKGGALWNFGKADLSKCFFSNNDAAKGAAIYNEASGLVTVSFGTFGNNSSDSGAGIYNQDGIVKLDHTLFDGNFAQQAAGVFNTSRGQVAVDNCVFSKSLGTKFNSAASDQGAAIYNDGFFNLVNSTVTTSAAKTDGGGIHNGGTITIESSTISNNESGGQGGGIYNTGTLSLLTSTVLLNKSTGDGGGISNAADTPGSAGSTITNSCLSNNTGKNGGGISNSATLNLINSTVANNQGQGAGFGGGVFNNGNMQITNSTLRGNTAGQTGEGGGIGASKPLTIQNSIVAENKSPGGGPDVWSKITSNGHNLIGNTQTAVGFDKTKGDLLGVDPRLTIVTVTGGPALYAPLPDSPAIDAGDNALAVQANHIALPSDERGRARIVNSFVDIGAVEVSYAVSTTAGSGQSASINTAFALPLKASVTESGAVIGDVPVTFTAPASGPSGTFPGNLRKLTLNTDSTGTVTAPAFTANASTGAYNVSASFLAGANFVATTFALTNAKATTSTALLSSANPSTAGHAVAFTAAVAPGAPGVPTGTVQFSSDGVNLGPAVPLLSNGAVTLTTTTLTAGQHTIAAQYSGDASFGPSTGTLTNRQVVGSLLEFKQAVYSASESAGSISITVTRSGDTTQSTSVNYATDDGSIPMVAVACSVVTGHALERCDYTRAAGTLQFAPGETQKTFTVLINDDSYREGTEMTSLVLANPGSGAAIGQQQMAELQIVDDTQPAANPIDDAAFFVRQHYHDFLNREPDQSGLDFWREGITSCGTDLNCAAAKRINTSGAFFLSIEFQNTGYFVERIYKTAYGDATGNSTFPSPHQVAVPIVRLREFLSDTQTIGRGVIVGQANWQQQFDTNKQTFALEFVSRQRFTSALPSTMSADQFVEQLDTNAGHVLSESQKAQLKGLFGGPSALSNDAARRAQALAQVAESQALQDREFNRAFVLMQFFGYLRRNPDEAPDADYTGYDFWLGKLNQFGGDFLKAEMVNAFLLSSEYRSRFGQ